MQNRGRRELIGLFRPEVQNTMHAKSCRQVLFARVMFRASISQSVSKLSFSEPLSFFFFSSPQAPSSQMLRFFAHTQTLPIPQLVASWQMRNSE